MSLSVRLGQTNAPHMHSTAAQSNLQLSQTCSSFLIAMWMKIAHTVFMDPGLLAFHCNALILLVEALKTREHVHLSARQRVKRMPGAHRSAAAAAAAVGVSTLDVLSNAVSSTPDSSSKLAQAVDTWAMHPRPLLPRSLSWLLLQYHSAQSCWFSLEGFGAFFLRPSRLELALHPAIHYYRDAAVAHELGPTHGWKAWTRRA